MYVEFVLQIKENRKREEEECMDTGMRKKIQKQRLFYTFHGWIVVAQSHHLI